MADYFDNLTIQKGSYLRNSKGQEVILPQFRSLNELEKLIPKTINKQLQDPFQYRIQNLLKELEDESLNDLQSFELPQQFSNKSESAFLHSLLKKQSFRETSCQFQNDYFLTFKERPAKDDLILKAELFAKVYMKNNLQQDRNKVQEVINQRKTAKNDDEHDRSVPLNPSSNIGGFLQRQESIEQENNELSQEIVQKIETLYQQLAKGIENKIYNCYQQNELDECILWKQRKIDLEQDMSNVVDENQLLHILEAFKMNYNI